MGITTNSKMLTLIIWKVLWENTNETHMIGMDKLCQYVSNYYEGNGKTERQLAKLISTNINQMNEFFLDSEYSLDGESIIQIKKKSIPNPDKKSGYLYMYYLSGRPFSDIDIRLISDCVLFSPGIGNKDAKGIIKKIQTLSGKYYGTWFDFVKSTDVVKRTNNKRLFEKLEVTGIAIKNHRKVMFEYKRNSMSETVKVVVSPYFLVISQGKYYLLCNKDGKETISAYRLDRIQTIALLENDISRKIDSLKEVPHPFNLKVFLAEHPRMSYEKTINVVLLVQNEMLDAVKEEFRAASSQKIDANYYRIRIVTTKSALSNWIINVGDKVKIEYSSDKTIYSSLCEKAKKIYEMYNGYQEKYLL